MSAVSGVVLWYCDLVSRAVAFERWVGYGDYEPCEPGVPCCDGCRWVQLSPAADPRPDGRATLMPGSRWLYSNWPDRR